ncbi:nephrin, partial [Eurytemora carolleeae]|uniref:nephrin n=1 Tax=Eurytemora carolleeae TaxID=1294199 RepID=UPI000C792992
MVGYISVQILGLLVVAGQEFNMDDFVAGQEFNMDDQEIVNFPLETADVQTTDAVNIEGLAGGTIELPCDLKPQIPGDELLLVLWYKIGFASPVYTFDVRNRSPGSARHYSDRTLFDEPTRAVMRAVVEPSALVISNLIPGDQGVYKCRADFKRSPTKHNLLNLTVIVPPHPPLIYDENGRRLDDEFGPILIGGKVVATCVSNGGKPEPSLQWWRGNKLLDDKSEIINGQSVNTVHLENIEQDDQGAHISCRALNSNGSNFAYRKLKLIIAYPPDRVWIEENSDKLTAGEEYNFTCRAVNSSGPTTFRWFIGKRELINHSQSKDNKLFSWFSQLRYTPRPGDNKANISCSVVNQLYPGQPRQHKIMLTVRYSPILSIKLGHSLLSEKIQAGEDVYFTCSVDSNPPTYNLTWRHNGKFLSENKENGILFGNHSLVLQGVKRKRSGLYTCIASNAVGDGESNAVSLDIK